MAVALIGGVAGFLLLPRKFAYAVVLLSLLQLWVFSLPIVADTLLYHLGKKHPPMTEISEEVDYIVILGAAHSNSPSPSSLSALGGDALKRLAEGVRLMQNQKNARLWLGGKTTDGINHAVLMSNAAVELGIREERILIRTEVHNTRTEMAAVKKDTQFGDNILIVSSAYHLPRVSRWAEYYELFPLYAPANSYPKPRGIRLARDLMPRADALAKSSIAWHEFFGTIHWFFHALPRLNF